MFRPIFIDADILFEYLMSFENFILFLIFIYPLFKFLKYLKIKKLKVNSISLFLIVYLSLTWTFFSITTPNLGLASRHKLMLIPALIYLSLSFSSKYNITNTENEYNKFI